jgi:DNA invertase Pin-like site-specific DNA recombinase
MPNTNGHGPKRVILYARVSTNEQARSGYENDNIAGDFVAMERHCPSANL